VHPQGHLEIIREHARRADANRPFARDLLRVVDGGYGSCRERGVGRSRS
jgi:hypothetical protein